jgi:hypothetical protein
MPIERRGSDTTETVFHGIILTGFGALAVFFIVLDATTVIPASGHGIEIG